MMGGMLLGDGPDFDQDKTVDSTDLDLMMLAQGEKGGRCDLNEDGIVDGADVDLLVKDWGAVTLD